MKRKKKRAVTLIEIMIVIVIIGIVGGALAFNMRGSLDEGKIFKTRQNISRVEDILTMALVQGELTTMDVADPKKWPVVVMRSPLAKSKEILTDGWNQQLEVIYDSTQDKVTASSQKLTAVEAKHAREKAKK